MKPLGRKMKDTRITEREVCIKLCDKTGSRIMIPSSPGSNLMKPASFYVRGISKIYDLNKKPVAQTRQILEGETGATIAILIKLADNNPEAIWIIE